MGDGFGTCILANADGENTVAAGADPNSSKKQCWPWVGCYLLHVTLWTFVGQVFERVILPIFWSQNSFYNCPEMEKKELNKTAHLSRFTKIALIISLPLTVTVTAL